MKNVKESYHDLNNKQLYKIWIMWKLVILKVIESNGDNTYVFPLKNRGVLERDGILKTTVVVCDEIIKIGDGMVLDNQKLITGYFRMKTRSIMKCLIRF